jgi:hypothetical protein
LKWIVQIGNEIVKQDLDRTEKSKQKASFGWRSTALLIDETVGRIIKATHPNNNIRVVSAFKILRSEYRRQCECLFRHSVACWLEPYSNPF